MDEQNNTIYQEPVFSKQVIEMLTVANEYCLYIEKAEDYREKEILEYLQKLLPIVYLKDSLLPEVEVTDESAAEHFVTEEQWENIFNKLRALFGEEDVFYFIDHQEKSHSDPIRASMAENLADIYQDLKDFVLLYQKPLKISKENAVKDCKFLFENRTGFRIVNTHAAIHYMLYRESEPRGIPDLYDL